MTAKLLLATVCALGAASVARADGLPVLGVDVGPTGVVAASGEARYVTLPAGGATVVARVEPTGGRVLGSRLLRGTFTTTTQLERKTVREALAAADDNELLADTEWCNRRVLARIHRFSN